MSKRGHDAIMSLLRNLFTCIGNRDSQQPASGARVKFGLPLSEAFQTTSPPANTTTEAESPVTLFDNHLPSPLGDLLVRLAQEGVGKRDLFRRSGNMADVKALVIRLHDGLPIQWSSQKNVYTLALVVKRFLMDIPGGLWGTEGERQLMEMVTSAGQLEEAETRCVYLSLLNNKSPAAYQLTVLLFGIWHSMVAQAISTRAPQPSETSPSTSTTTVASVAGDVISLPAGWWQVVEGEAVAKSVAGSVFHSCRESPEMVDKAALVLQFLILNFPTLSPEAVEYYRRATSPPSQPETPTSGPPTVTAIVRRASDKAMSSLDKYTGKGSSGVFSARSQQPVIQQAKLSQAHEIVPVEQHYVADNQSCRTPEHSFVTIGDSSFIVDTPDHEEVKSSTPLPPMEEPPASASNTAEPVGRSVRIPRPGPPGSSLVDPSASDDISVKQPTITVSSPDILQSVESTSAVFILQSAESMSLHESCVRRWHSDSYLGDESSDEEEEEEEE